MDIFGMGSVRSQMTAISMRTEWEHMKETGEYIKPSKAYGKFDKNDINAFKPAVIEQPKDEKTGEEKIREEIEALYKTIQKQIEEAKKLREEYAEKKAAEEADKTSKQTEKGNSDKKGNIPEWVKEQMELMNSSEKDGAYDKNSDGQLHSINNKLLSGIALTQTEMQYLMKRDPIAYQNAQRVNSDRKFYGKMLSCCRTKDDVHALRLSNSLSALAELKKIKSGSANAESLGLIMQRNAAFEREFNCFIKRGCYSALPTKAECHKVYSDLRKARKYEREKKAAEAAAKKKKTQAARKKALKYKKNPGDGKQTTYQILRSPTAKKVFRSRRKSGCSALRTFCFSGKKSK